MLTLYGITQSRAFRPLWVMQELGLEYHQVELDFRGDGLSEPDYLALNPNGRIPTLVDGDLVLWESMAIDLYLARRYGGDSGLWPDDAAGEALAWQWSFWVMSEVEHALLTVLMHKRILPEERRDPARAGRNLGLLKRPFGVLDTTLRKRAFLAGDRFTIADLNVAAVLSWCGPARVSLNDHPHLQAWLKTCLARPARKRAQKAVPDA
ncbi:MAG: glutathione S-transferase family protein [Gammaproteobacteria bacterium]|nr:glutathione S-transferase family protein [Gammaproteobacteria bacterium]